jgi:hypothetical protein
VVSERGGTETPSLSLSYSGRLQRSPTAVAYSGRLRATVCGDYRDPDLRLRYARILCRAPQMDMLHQLPERFLEAS